MHNSTLLNYLLRKHTFTPSVNPILLKNFGLFLLLVSMLTFNTQSVFGNTSVLENSSELTPLPIDRPGAINGETNVCEGDTKEYYVNPVNNATGYIWTMPDWATIISDDPNSNRIMISFSGSTQSSGNIRVKAYNATEISNQDNHKEIKISRLSIAPTTITINNVPYTDQSICYNTNGVTQNIHLKVSGGDKGSNGGIRWYEGSCNGTFKSNAEQIDGNVTLGSSKTYYVSYRGDCNETECISVTLYTTGSLDGTSIGAITGQQDVCKNSSTITYTVPAVTNAENYTWTLPSGASPTTGNLVTTTNSITVDYVDANSGNVTVVANGVGDCGGNSLQSSLAINIEDIPNTPSFINPISDICYGDTKTYTVTAIPGATSYNWTVPTDAVITSGDGTNTITVDFNTAISGAITVAVENGCGTGDTITLPLSFNTVPGNPESITGPTLLCPGETMVEYTIPSLPNTTSYNWTISNSSASFNGTSNTNAIALDIANAALNDFTISVVGVNDCGESVTASELLVSVNKKSTAPTTMTSSNSNTICEGTSTTLGITGGLQGTGASLEWYTDAALTNTAGSGETITVTPSETTTYYVRYEGTCNDTSVISQVITVNEESTQPTTITSTSGDTFCEGTQTTLGITGGSQGTGASLEWYTDAALTNSAGSGETITVTPSETTTFYVRYEGTCNNTSVISQVITVNKESTQPTTISSSNGDTFCGGTTSSTLTVTGGSLGTEASIEWYIDTSFNTNVGSGTTINIAPTETTTYYVRHEGLCNTTGAISQTITVNPLPIISVNQPSQTICSDGSIAPITILNDNSVTGISYAWTRTNTSNLTGIPASGSGSSISGALKNTTGTPQTTMFTITATANGCTSETTATVIVNPEPVISVNQPSQTICSDGSIAPITILNDNSVSGISYTWTRNNTSNLTGISASGSGTPISGTSTNNTGTVQTTTFTITATANGCTSETTATVTVNPEPVISVNQSSQTICSDGTISPITVSNDNSVTGISYTWTRTNTSNLTGIAASGSGSPISGVLKNTTGTPQTTTFTITASANGCTNETTATVTVNPKPILILDSSAAFTSEICSGETTDITITDNQGVDKTLSYVWTRTNTSNISGPATGDSNTINVALTNSTNSPQTTTFTVRANSEYGCLSEPFTVAVIVNPAPTVSATNTLQEICFGEAITPIVISNPNGIAGVSYSWTRNNTTGITGLESGTSETISGTLVNTTNTPQTTTFTITANANGCDSQIKTATITVYPELVISVTPDANINLDVCSDVEITPIELLNDNGLENVTYFWERTDNVGTVSGLESGTGPIISGVLSSTHSQNRTITIKAWAEANGCKSNELTDIKIRVRPTPIVEVTPSAQAVCDGDTFSMEFSNKYDTNYTTYTWTRDNTTNVTGIAGSGTSPNNTSPYTLAGTLTNTTTETQTVTFTVTATRSALGCSTTTTATIDVYAPLTTPVIGDDQDMCLGEDPTDLKLLESISGGSGDYSYQWQSATSLNGTWSNVGNASTYSPPRQSRFYRLIVTDNYCSSSSLISNPISINYVFGLGGIFDEPTVNNPPSYILCPGQSWTPEAVISHSTASDVDYDISYNSSYISAANNNFEGTETTFEICEQVLWWNVCYDAHTTTAQIPVTVKNDGNATVNTSLFVTPTFRNGLGTCNSDQLEVPFEIYPTPKIESVISEDATICSGTSASILVDGNITDNPMEFSWTRTTPSGITGNTSGTSGNIAANAVYTLNNILTNNTSSPITVTYTITPKSTTGCGSGTPVTYDIIVEPFIEASASIVGTIDSCDDTTVQLTANTNISGVWTALPLGGVFSSTTDPNATFIGESGTDYILKWTVTNGVLCGESSTEVAVNIPACIGNDFDFNGTNTSVNFGNAYNLVGPFSIEIWAKPNSTTGNQTILSKRSPSNATNGYDLTLANGNTVAFNWNNGKSISTSGLSPNRWYHVAVTYNGSSYKLYVDGVLKTTKNNESGPQINSSLALLGAIQSSILPSNYFNGWLDELRIWNTALSVNQIREMMNQEIQNNGGKVRGSIIPLDIIGELDWNSNLVGYYQMGSNIINGTLASANGATSGVLRNMTTMQQETAPLPYESNGNSNWDSAAAWMNADVNQLPNSNEITWNIVKIKNNVSLDKSTTVLGLIVENNTLTVPDNMPLNVTKYLKLDGTLKLENEAQLLQPEGSIVDYSGTGGLLRDQEGTTNVFNYNYWASPVSTGGTENNRTYKLSEVLHVGTNPVGWTANHDGAAGNPPSISTRWLYTFYNKISDYNNWTKITQNDDINVGLGYSMKGATNADYTFIGQPNNGDILVNVDAGNVALVGNPYPSAIDVREFITDNEPVLKDENGNNGEIRLWIQSSTNNTHVTKEYVGGYASLNLTGGNAAVAPDDIAGVGDANSITPQRYISVAQGFFITAAIDGNIIFNNGQRIFKTEASGSSAFLRSDGTTEESTDDVQRVRLAFKSPDNAIRQLLLGFTPDNTATDNVDFGYDATNFDELSSDMLFLINDKTYVIQGVGEFDKTKQYPLAMFIGKNGNIEISLKELENFDSDIDVFIYDSYEDSYTQINDSKYQMHLEKGDYLDRYFLAFNNESRLDIIDNDLSEIKINYLNDSDEIQIKTPNHVNIKQVYLINTLGQTVKAWNTTNATLSSNCKIPVQRISEGHYIIKITTEKGSTTKKVTIQY